ncbi:hypothetical protein CWATWH0003_B283 [Crocosphaera watsonii WH 0003]|uniref:Uncharacterized protein n=1 Tax=Crocosphaera watsonii WH 0003 TaxID=423471 RepID=G5JEU6_CROWT|nr:hypothetical protein CWATWH0003_B283 [Crocosphaera watsonii WH 0003]
MYNDLSIKGKNFKIEPLPHFFALKAETNNLNKSIVNCVESGVNS